MSKKKITLLSHDFSNLKEKTVFDYTNDKEILCEMFALPTDDRLTGLIIKTKEFCEQLKHYERYSHFARFARIIEDEELDKEACKQFGVGYE